MLEVDELIIEYFNFEVGSYIENPEKEIFFSNAEILIRLKYRALKHIVEKRKIDNYSKEQISNLFNDLSCILFTKDYKLIKNVSKGEGNFLLLQTVFQNGVGVVVALELVLLKDNEYFIKTMFYRSVSKIKKLLQQ